MKNRFALWLLALFAFVISAVAQPIYYISPYSETVLTNVNVTGWRVALGVNITNQFYITNYAGSITGAFYGVYLNTNGTPIGYSYVSNLNGFATNLTVRASADDVVPLQIYAANGSGVDFLTIFDAAGNPYLSLDNQGVLRAKGSGLTNLNGTYIDSGTVADARIASTIARDSEVTTATQNVTNNSLYSLATNEFRLHGASGKVIKYNASGYWEAGDDNNTGGTGTGSTNVTDYHGNNVMIPNLVVTNNFTNLNAYFTNVTVMGTQSIGTLQSGSLIVTNGISESLNGLYASSVAEAPKISVDLSISRYVYYPTGSFTLTGTVNRSASIARKTIIYVDGQRDGYATSQVAIASGWKTNYNQTFWATITNFAKITLESFGSDETNVLFGIEYYKR